MNVRKMNLIEFTYDYALKNNISFDDITNFNQKEILDCFTLKSMISEISQLDDFKSVQLRISTSPRIEHLYFDLSSNEIKKLTMEAKTHLYKNPNQWNGNWVVYLYSIIIQKVGDNLRLITKDNKAEYTEYDINNMRYEKLKETLE